MDETQKKAIVVLVVIILLCILSFFIGKYYSFDTAYQQCNTYWTEKIKDCLCVESFK